MCGRTQFCYQELILYHYGMGHWKIYPLLSITIVSRVLLSSIFLFIVLVFHSSILLSIFRKFLDILLLIGILLRNTIDLTTRKIRVFPNFFRKIIYIKQILMNPLTVQEIKTVFLLKIISTLLLGSVLNRN